MLSNKVLRFLVCVLLSVHVSTPYVIMGLIHASTVCSAASVFLLISCKWSSRLFLMFMVSPRYLYWTHGSMCMSLIPRECSSFLDLFLGLPVVMVCDLFFPFCFLYFSAISSVISSSVFWSFMLSVIIAMSSTHRRLVELGSMMDSFSCFAVCISCLFLP